MAALAGATRAGFVLLTALLTLVAGLPHVRCRCPSGRVIPFCLGSLFHGATGCCAAESPSSPDGCCASANGAETDPGAPSCCCHASAAWAEEAASEARLAAGHCTKSLTAADDLATASRHPGSAPASDSFDLLPPAGILAAALQDREPPSRQGHSLAPPPTDLVTALQRLTI
jgi:hypothetical protein